MWICFKIWSREIKNNKITKLLDIIKIKIYNKIAFDLEVYYIMKEHINLIIEKKLKSTVSLVELKVMF